MHWEWELGICILDELPSVSPTHWQPKTSDLIIYIAVSVYLAARPYSPGGLPCPAAAVAIAKAEAGETEQWELSAVCPGYLKEWKWHGEADRSYSIIKILIFIPALDEAVGQMLCTVLVNRKITRFYIGNSTLDIYPREVKTYPNKNLYMNIPSSIILNSPKVQIPKCPSTIKWINQMCYINTREYYRATKRNEVLMHITTWMVHENITLSERSQSQKVMSSMILSIWNVWNR